MRPQDHALPAPSTAGQAGRWIPIATATRRRMEVQVSALAEVELGFLRDGADTVTGIFRHCAGSPPARVVVPEGYRLAARRPAFLAGATTITVDQEG